MESIREQTQAHHTAVEQTDFAIKMARGELTDRDYSRYLKVQHLIFLAMEMEWRLPRKDLKRAPLIVSDIEHMDKRYIDEEAPSAVYEYVNHIVALKDERKINAHIYLNYMGMMFGGQLIKKNVPTEGKMYEFNNRSDLIKSIRELDIEVNEVKNGFDWHRLIFIQLG
jgi:heme oxygenase